MATTKNVRGRGSGQQRSNPNGRTYVYVDGNVVRRLEQAPARDDGRKKNPSASRQTRKNRERALQMNFAYVTFLTVAAVITMVVCVNYLQLRAMGTKLQKDVTELEAELDAAILENDSDYQRIMNSVDLEYIRDVAMNELGMEYAKQSQIVTYETEDSDYVRQYSEIPAE